MTSAAQHNAHTEEQRQRARDRDSNVVDLTVDDATRAQRIREITTEFDRLKAEGKAINESRKACLERIDALGLDRNEFKSLVKLLDLDEEQRAKRARTRREFLRAHNIPDQLGLFDEPAPAAAATESDGNDGDNTGGALADLRRRWAEEDARVAAEQEAQLDDVADAPGYGILDDPEEAIDEEADPNLYERAGVTVVAGEDDDG